MTGKFIVVEGIEGSGKSTLANGLSEFLLAQGQNVLLTKEPGGTEVGKSIRSLLLDSDEEISPKAELLLFLADRAQHIEQFVRPSLAAGMTVICDRFFYSTFAYQGAGRGMAREELELLNGFATGGLLPDRVFLVDLEVETALARASKRRDVDHASWNRFEAETLDFHQRIRNGFLDLQKADPARIKLLDGNLAKDELLNAAKLFLP